MRVTYTLRWIEINEKMVFAIGMYCIGIGIRCLIVRCAKCSFVLSSALFRCFGIFRFFPLFLFFFSFEQIDKDVNSWRWRGLAWFHLLPSSLFLFLSNRIKWDWRVLIFTKSIFKLWHASGMGMSMSLSM